MENPDVLDATSCESLKEVDEMLNDERLPRKILLNERVGNELRNSVGVAYRKLMRMRWDDLVYRAIKCEVVDGK